MHESYFRSYDMFELFTRNSYTFPLEYLKKPENVCSFAFSIALYIVLICTSRYASYVSRILMINPSHNTIHVMFVITFHFVYVYCFPIIHFMIPDVGRIVSFPPHENRSNSWENVAVLFLLTSVAWELCLCTNFVTLVAVLYVYIYSLSNTTQSTQFQSHFY